MLDRLPAWLRHAVIGLLYSILSIGVPLLASHQGDVRDWIVGTLHLPLLAAPIVGLVLGSLILRLTPLTRQYGVGASTPPAVPVIAPAAPPAA